MDTDKKKMESSDGSGTTKSNQLSDASAIADLENREKKGEEGKLVHLIEGLMKAKLEDLAKEAKDEVKMLKEAVGKHDDLIKKASDDYKECKTDLGKSYELSITNYKQDVKRQSDEIEQYKGQLKEAQKEVTAAKTAQRLAEDRLFSQAVPNMVTDTNIDLFLSLKTLLSEKDMEQYEKLVNTRTELQNELQIIKDQGNVLVNNMWGKIGVSSNEYYLIATIALTLSSLTCSEAIPVGILLGLIFCVWSLLAFWVAKSNIGNLKDKVEEYVKLESTFENDVNLLDVCTKAYILESTVESATTKESVKTFVEHRISALKLKKFESENFVSVLEYIIIVTMVTNVVVVFMVFGILVFRFCVGTKDSCDKKKNEDHAGGDGRASS